MKQQQKALFCAVCKVSVYTAGGLWRTRLNYDRNVLRINVKVAGATSSEGRFSSCLFSEILTSLSVRRH